MTGRWSESLEQLRKDIEQEHEIAVAVQIMDNYAELYEQDNPDERGCNNGMDTNN